MRYRLALFDFDGTLADTLPWFTRAMGEVAAEFGFRRVDGDELEQLRGKDNREILASLGVPMWKVPLIARRMRAMAARDLGEMRLFPGIPEALRTLRESDVAVGIVSSNSEANVRRVLGPATCELIGAYGCGVSLFGKAARLKKVIGASGVGSAEVIYVGDEIRDVQAARQLGIASGAVSWGFHTPEALASHGPTATFASVREMVELITRP